MSNRSRTRAFTLLVGVQSHFLVTEPVRMCTWLFAEQNASEANVHMLKTFEPAVLPELAFQKCLLKPGGGASAGGFVDA